MKSLLFGKRQMMDRVLKRQDKNTLLFFAYNNPFVVMWWSFARLARDFSLETPRDSIMRGAIPNMPEWTNWLSLRPSKAAYAGSSPVSG